MTDPVVKYYDDVFALSASDDIAWFLEKALANPGRVLDLACGTGRISLALARAGLEVTAVDQSQGMLDSLRSKLTVEAEPVRKSICTVVAGMRSFDLSDRFSTIVCCDAFFHNLTVDDQISCLQRAACHLTRRGLLLFNIPNPSIAFLSLACSPEGRRFSRRDEYALRDTEDTLLVEEAHEANLGEQTVKTRLRFTRFSPQGEIVSIEESSWRTRFTFKYEAIHLLHRCGFEVETLSGDYMGRPVTEKSQLVFAARLRD